MGMGIRSLIFGAVFVVGGLSGQLVFIGTNSSELLIGVGVILIVAGVIQVARENHANTPAQSRIKAGDRVVVNEETMVYTEMDSRSAPITRLDPGHVLKVVSAAETNDVQWLCVRVPSGQEGYVLGYKFQ